MKTRFLNMEDGRAGSPPPAADHYDDGAHEVSRPTLRLWLVIGLLVSVLHLPAFAQSYSIDWYKVAGGGGVSTGGVYSVSGTIGQPEAGANCAMSGGNYSLTGGFWSLYAVQTPGAPLLAITLSGNQARISWDSSVTGWTLQTNNNLATGAWGNYAGPVVNNSVTNAPPKGNLFFRLTHP